ncbi:PREDICTED: putative late blight resistance protein homolog R1A-10 isoform X2 [Nicotiana attenuata]|uniref:Late blight resistance protein -like r1a-6 n=2 Tax=Nicotiana attenuata TaxID=49451 RepID=A0A1J6I962_NICAT|nr:PREDICTED: putative late blight resistance protein homolog R1A-10 isoform X2 [Nicotiana attenuata]OIT01549.1 putative late blight resistance protein -like r1a-6 [Nicotiana attenuata]
MAYASVASLMSTMESVLTSKSPVQSLIFDHQEELLALREKVSSLEVFLKNFEKSNKSEEMTDFATQIKDVANAVERTIQLRLTESLTANDGMQTEKAHERLCDSLKQVAEEIDRVLKESPKIQDKGKQALKESLVQDSSSKKNTADMENNMVGRDEQRKRMLAELAQYGGSSGELKVIPIIGMGGIGKTTLAKEVYNDASIRRHFDVRCWATVSSQYNLKEILLSLLRCTKGITFYMEDEADLADMLQKSLKSRRYLIVLDDVWSSKAWDDVRQCFPVQNNGSRILLTTRNNEVACSAGTKDLSLPMGLMSPVESWNLFKSAAFPNESLPSDFETIGKQIVDKCHGLPLTIVVVAGLLKFKRTIEDWENVAKDVKSITNDPDKQCLHVLGLSYNHLTSDLKACLLYFGIFPEDSAIPVKKLVRLWTAEGFLKLEKDLQGEAEKCLQDLIDRCLVLVCKKSLDETNIKSCKVHDLIYDLCLRELAQTQDIFAMNDISTDKLCLAEAQSSNLVRPECRHLSMHEIRPFQRQTGIHFGSYRALLTPRHHHLIRGQTADDNNNLLNRTHSIFSLYRHPSTFTLESEVIHFSLLRILDLNPIRFDSFPPQLLCLIWLRYLAMSGDFHLPPEICRLWNLQTFIVHGYRSASTSFPEQIWELMQLRHLEIERFYLPNPPSLSVDKERSLGFSDMQSISGLSPTSCTMEVISGIRNVKKLRIYGVKNEYERFQESRLYENLVHLHQLETLSLKFIYLGWSDISPATIPSAKAFPATLKKLKLHGTRLRWEDLNIIGELPNLEVLKLIYYACYGKEWYPVAGGFTQLKLLQIAHSDLRYLKATDDNFPVLERLVITDCSYLVEIPIEFADIDSLQLIELNDCFPGLKASAARIQQEQEDLGNKPVDVRIYNSPDSDSDDDDGNDYVSLMLAACEE